MDIYMEIDLFTSGDGGVREFRIPALATTRNGTLIAVCDARVDRVGDAPNNIDLVMRRSVDDGETWTPIEVIARFPGEEAACDPCLLVDRDTGTVWVFYDYAVPREGFPRGREMFFHAIRSDDDGVTWSEPWDMTERVVDPAWSYLSVGPGRGVQTRGGTLMVPVYSMWKDDSRQCHLLCSEDHGATWEVRAGVPDVSGESQAAELDDGSIMLNMRQPRSKGRRKVAISKDDGRSWGEVWEDDALVDPGCMACLMKYDHPGTEKRPLVFSNSACPDDRRDMTVKLSFDEGKTWPVAQLVRSGRAMYSCLTTLADGKVGLLYETGVTVVFAKFAIEEMAKNPSPSSRIPQG